MFWIKRSVGEEEAAESCQEQVWLGAFARSAVTKLKKKQNVEVHPCVSWPFFCTLDKCFEDLQNVADITDTGAHPAPTPTKKAALAYLTRPA